MMSAVSQELGREEPPSAFDFNKELDAAGHTILHMLADPAIILQAGQEGADTDVFCKHGLAPIHYAARNNQIAKVKALLKLGAAPDLETKENTYIDPSQTEHVQRRLREAKTAGITPLMMAAASHYMELCELLIQNGAKVNHKTPSENSCPLASAMISDRLDVAVLLLSHGADPNLKLEDGKSLLHTLCEHGRSFDTVMPNRKSAIRLLVLAGADLNKKDNNGNTPLHYCKTTGGYEDGAQFLIDLGADPTIKNDAGKRASDGR